MRTPKSHADEETSSTGNMQTMGPNVKRKRGDSNNCHQCHRRDKEKVVRCTKCKQKNYCIPCIAKWYSRMEEADIVEACPACRNICNCAACLQSAGNKDLPIPELEFCTEEKIRLSQSIVTILLPSLKKFVVEQNVERAEEAKIQGLSITRLQVPKANISHNDHVQCNNCKTSIFDVHRSCPNCLYKLCVPCCQEIRDGFPQEYGQYHVHGVVISFTTNDESCWAASCCMDDPRSVSEWRLTEKGTIICPPEDMGGCGHGNLELYSTYPDGWVPELLVKAEAVANLDKISDALQLSERACTCLRSDRRSELESNLCDAASREDSNDNYLYCPTAVDIGKPGLKHFQWHLYKGEPVIVPNVLSATSGLSWEPLVMWRACRKSRKTNDLRILDFSVLNCLNWCEETINMHQFFKGYLDGLLETEGRLRILKLEDWPPSESFQERLPRHSGEFIRCLPFKHYTHPHAGYLNMSVKIPDISLRPELGPKMSICYGGCWELGCGSITNLQYALSDRLNVLMHTAEICLSPERLSTIEELRRTHVAQEPAVFSVSNARTNEEAKTNQLGEKEKENKGTKLFDPAISRNGDRGFEDPEGGAIWDIFRRQDVPKLEKYLRKHSREFSHSFPLQQLVHPVHEKAFYLTVEHKRTLKEEYGIEPWTIVQRLGDAVFVPAGCPHQIRNLKSCTSVAVNFVSPESVGECLRLSEEYRSLPHNHKCKEDRLQVKKMTLHAVSQALEYLDTMTPSTSRCTNPPPFVPVDANMNLTNSEERAHLASMRKDLEEKKSILEEEGRNIAPNMRAHLEDSIRRLLDRIGSLEGSSSSS